MARTTHRWVVGPVLVPLLFVMASCGMGAVPAGPSAAQPRVTEAQELLKRVRIHAMMDISDGLASDLWQMARASRVGIQIEAGSVPIHKSAKTLASALGDGEDFELLFAVSKREAVKVPARIGRTPVSRIGEAVGRQAGVRIRMPDGRVCRLLPGGYKHF